MENPTHPSIKTELPPIIFLTVELIFAIYFYIHFPQRVAIHFDLHGQPNGYGSKFFASFFLFGISLLIYLVFLAIPYIDPRKERYAEFSKAYHRIKNYLIFLYMAIFIVAGLKGLGYNLNDARVIPVLVGALLAIIGNYMSKVKRNWMIGIRTPWTLSNEEVWNKTHRLGGKIFVICGLLMIISALLPFESIGIIIGIIAVMAFTPVIYSYVVYTQIQNQK